MSMTILTHPIDNWRNYLDTLKEPIRHVVFQGVSWMFQAMIKTILTQICAQTFSVPQKGNFTVVILIEVASCSWKTRYLQNKFSISLLIYKCCCQPQPICLQAVLLFCSGISELTIFPTTAG